MKSVIIIPAYKPQENLIGLIDTLLSLSLTDIIIVDDGSGPQYADLFQQCRKKNGVSVLQHAVNLGKGQALKTAFNHFLVHYPEQEYGGVITADADGQHLPQDIKKLSLQFQTDPQCLLLGAREFKKDTPLRSLFGNIVTRNIFKLMVGKRIQDTQTGLRAIPRYCLSTLLTIKASRYDYELDMLIRASLDNVNIIEVPINTVYLDGNASSHFNPLIDSLKIYYVFLRFAALSLATAALDFIIFSFAFLMGHSIFISTVFSRLIAGSFNFFVSKHRVFHSGENGLKEAIKYIALVVFLMLIAYSLVQTFVNSLGINVFFSKIMAELSLFILSFSVQRLFVFTDSLNSVPSQTNWDRYYSNQPRAASFTRKITEKMLLRLFKKYQPSGLTSICELGGANSCFFSAIRQEYPHANYTIIDNNETGLELFKQRFSTEPNISLYQDDVTTLDIAPQKQHIVFSTGLIEHFDKAGTKDAIAAHFKCAAPGSLVVMTFPTPTLLYRLVRKIAECCNQWIFHDERPLTFKEVLTETEKHGEVINHFINWGVILTQGVVVVRARG